MTAQEIGLKMLTREVREIVPPQLDFVVLVYRPTGDLGLSATFFLRDGQTPDEMLARAREAAKGFIEQKPIASFNPKS